MRIIKRQQNYQIVLNELTLPVEDLERKLITDLAQIIPAEKRSSQKGVYWNKSSRKWEARIRVSGKAKWIGSFINETDAIQAFKKAVNENIR